MRLIRKILAQRHLRDEVFEFWEYEYGGGDVAKFVYTWTIRQIEVLPNDLDIFFIQFLILESDGMTPITCLFKYLEVVKWSTKLDFHLKKKDVMYEWGIPDIVFAFREGNLQVVDYLYELRYKNQKYDTFSHFYGKWENIDGLHGLIQVGCYLGEPIICFGAIRGLEAGCEGEEPEILENKRKIDIIGVFFLMIKYRRANLLDGFFKDVPDFRQHCPHLLEKRFVEHPIYGLHVKFSMQLKYWKQEEFLHELSDKIRKDSDNVVEDIAFARQSGLMI